MKLNILETYKKLNKFFDDLSLQKIHFVIPSFFALIASCFEGMSIAFLAPTMRGLMESDFRFAAKIQLIGPFISTHPSIFAGSNAAVFIFLVGMIFASAASKNMFFYFSSVLVARQVRKLSHQLRRKLFDHYMTFSKSFFDRHNSGHLHHILIGYTEQIATQFISLNQALFSFFSLCIYLSLMFFISWKMTLFVLLLFPFLYMAFKGLILSIQTDSQHFSDAYSSMGKKIANALGCIPLIKASVAEEKEKKWFVEVSGMVREYQMSMDKKNLMIQPLQDIFILAVTVLLVGFMAYLIIRCKEGSISSFLVFFVLLRRAAANIGVFNSLQGGVAMIRGPFNEVMHIFEDAKTYYEKDGGIPFGGLKSEIVFKDVLFCHGESNVLNGLSFKIEKGKMTALVGKTGAGKSTIANLMMRFYSPPAGTLFIDGIDINDFQIKSLRKKTTYIPQENYFFDASLRINLVFGLDRDVNDDELLRAIEDAQLMDFYKKIPNGLETEIGERGIRLSGGEKQRLSIARAMLWDPDILILDEATSAMDSQTEMLIQRAIEKLTKGKTSIVIAHRLSTIRRADQILVIENGRVSEQGSFAELLGRKGDFFDMWQKQSFLT